MGRARKKLFIDFRSGRVFMDYKSDLGTHIPYRVWDNYKYADVLFVKGEVFLTSEQFKEFISTIKPEFKNKHMFVGGKCYRRNKRLISSFTKVVDENDTFVEVAQGRAEVYRLSMFSGKRDKFMTSFIYLVNIDDNVDNVVKIQDNGILNIISNNGLRIKKRT